MNHNNQTLVGEMQIPEGYKNTQIGIFPQEWELMTIKEALESKSLLDQMDGNHGELYPRSNEFSQSGVAYIGATDFSDNKVDFKNCKFLPLDRAKKFRKGIAKSGDVLFAHNATVGPAALLKTDDDFVILSTTATYYRCNDKHINNQYLLSFFESNAFKQQYSAVMSQSTRNQVSILAQRKFKLVLPNREEQALIANSLRDIQDLISELEKLIKKKQSIKTATMQQLLTGKTRLPEFALREDGTPKGYKDSELGRIPEDWDLSRVGDALKIKHGKSQKSVESNDGKFPILATGGQIGWAKEYLYNKPSVLIGRKGTINKPRFVDQPFWSVDTLFYSEINDKYCAKFLFYKFCRIDWNNYNEASGVPSLNAKTIENVHISVCSLDEQEEIVKILNDLDSEITRLKDKCIKLFNIKKSMMQELLTGKTRLV